MLHSCLDATSKAFIASQTQCYLLAQIPQGIQGKAVILYVLTAEVNDSITTPNTRCTAQLSVAWPSLLHTTPPPSTILTCLLVSVFDYQFCMTDGAFREGAVRHTCTSAKHHLVHCPIQSHFIIRYLFYLTSYQTFGQTSSNIPAVDCFPSAVMKFEQTDKQHFQFCVWFV